MSSLTPDVVPLPEEAEELDEATQERIREDLATYEKDLRKRYRRQDDLEIRKKRRKSYLDDLIERELENEAREEDELREEEHFLVSSNLKLTLVFLAVFTVASMMVSDRIEAYSMSISNWVTVHLGWFYVLLSGFTLPFLAYLALSRFGSVVLGDPDDEPEFDDLSWTSMLFSAGMGVGLLFYGGAEPLSHYLAPPLADPSSIQAAREGLTFTVFHWGLNAWGIYVLCAVSVAYYGFRRQKKYLVSSAILDMTKGPTSRKALKMTSDLVSTLAVVFGVAASLGMGVLQIAGGIEYTFGIDATCAAGYSTILAAVTLLFILSACTGLGQGIKILSNLNTGVAVLLLLFILFTGPTLFILKLFVDTLGQYIWKLPALSFQIAPFTPAYETWMGRWTLTYFTWWIAWAPFVGIFIARISKGRTIRELIVGALLIPTLFTVLWFSALGGAALHLEMAGGSQLGALVQKDITIALFALLEQFPLSGVTSMVSLLLLFTFLVTSADSACFVISMMTTEGDLDPSIRMKVMWGVILAVLTFILTLGGGLSAIQAAALTFAFPFSLVLILMALSVRVRLAMQVEGRRI